MDTKQKEISETVKLKNCYVDLSSCRIKMVPKTIHIKNEKIEITIPLKSDIPRLMDREKIPGKTYYSNLQQDDNISEFHGFPSTVVWRPWE